MIRINLRSGFLVNGYDEILCLIKRECGVSVSRYVFGPPKKTHLHLKRTQKLKKLFRVVAADLRCVLNVMKRFYFTLSYYNYPKRVVPISRYNLK